MRLVQVRPPRNEPAAQCHHPTPRTNSICRQFPEKISFKKKTAPGGAVFISAMSFAPGSNYFLPFLAAGFFLAGAFLAGAFLATGFFAGFFLASLAAAFFFSARASGDRSYISQ